MTSILLNCRNMDRMLHLLRTRTGIPGFVSGRLTAAMISPCLWVLPTTPALRVTIKSFPFPYIVSSDVPVPHTFTSILPPPDESRILIRTMHDIQGCSLKYTDHTRDAHRPDIVGIDFSGDASLLALSTRI